MGVTHVDEVREWSSRILITKDIQHSFLECWLPDVVLYVSALQSRQTVVDVNKWSKIAFWRKKNNPQDPSIHSHLIQSTWKTRHFSLCRKNNIMIILISSHSVWAIPFSIEKSGQNDWTKTCNSPRKVVIIYFEVFFRILADSWSYLDLSFIKSQIGKSEFIILAECHHLSVPNPSGYCAKDEINSSQIVCLYTTCTMHMYWVWAELDKCRSTGRSAASCLLQFHMS